MFRTENFVTHARFLLSRSLFLGPFPSPSLPLLPLPLPRPLSLSSSSLPFPLPRTLSLFLAPASSLPLPLPLHLPLPLFSLYLSLFTAANEAFTHAGNTAVHHALVGERTAAEVLKQLLAYERLHVDVRNLEGKSALDVCTDVNLKQLLQRHHETRMILLLRERNIAFRTFACAHTQAYKLYVSIMFACERAQSSIDRALWRKCVCM